MTSSFATSPGNTHSTMPLDGHHQFAIGSLAGVLSSFLHQRGISPVTTSASIPKIATQTLFPEPPPESVTSFPSSLPMNKGPFGVEQIKFVVQTAPGLDDGRRVANHADGPGHCGQISTGNDGRRLVVDANLSKIGFEKRYRQINNWNKIP